jgi:hypothetical protein
MNGIPIHGPNASSAPIARLFWDEHPSQFYSEVFLSRWAQCEMDVRCVSRKERAWSGGDEKVTYLGFEQRRHFFALEIQNFLLVKKSRNFQRCRKFHASDSRPEWITSSFLLR